MRHLRIFLLCGLLGVAVAVLAQPHHRGQRRMAFTTDTLMVHDPAMAWEDGTFYILSTGMGLQWATSQDRKTWVVQPTPFIEHLPQWTQDSVPGFRNHVWAPDVLRWHDRWWLAYSCSTFGKNTSAIGLMTADRLNGEWKDEGCLVASRENRDNWNAIDPAFVVDGQDRLWLTWGSFWDGIQICEASPLNDKEQMINKKTSDSLSSLISHLSFSAKRAKTIARRYQPGDTGAAENPTSKYAGRNAIEAPFILRHGDWYYLFVSWDYCCRGAKSNYRVAVGRSKAVDGPYLDRDGRPMTEGGGTLLLEGDKQEFEAAGHCAAYDLPTGESVFICHGYSTRHGGASILIQRDILWTSDGWPTFAGNQPASIDGAWHGILRIGQQQLTVSLNIDQSRQHVTMGVLEQGVDTMAVEVKHLSADSISIAISKLGLLYMARLDSAVLRGTFIQQLYAAKLDMQPGGITFNRPQTPMPPFPYTTEEVRFTNTDANVSLAGTLTWPQGYQPGQRTPVVLMVTGSGPQNRDEEVFHHKPFLVLADHLARLGIASLRYDDRGVGGSTGQFDNALTDDFAADAQAGIDYLRRLDAFSQVGILGHSEGGIIAYMLGSRQVPDFIVSLSGPACRLDTMFMVQLNLIARSQGALRDVAKSVEEARNFILAKNGDSPWFRHFLGLDMASYVSQTRCPVMALGGERDLNVPVKLNVPALEQHLPQDSRNVIKVYSGLSHLFQHSPTGNPSLSATIEETISPEVLNDISTWIKSL